MFRFDVHFEVALINNYIVALVTGVSDTAVFCLYMSPTITLVLALEVAFVAIVQFFFGLPHLQILLLFSIIVASFCCYGSLFLIADTINAREQNRML